MNQVEWKPGDRVVHRARPEWGVGAVTEAQKSVQDGVRCQRLTVRFETGGLKTVSTAFADLRRADPGASAHGSPQRTARPVREPAKPGGRAGLPVAIEINGTDEADLRERLASLPDDAADPFRPLESRIRATLDLYRYTDQGGSLLAWASAVSGLSDPLSRVGRHELEQAFHRFEVLRDRHLSQLMQAAPREGVDTAALIRAMPPEAQRALQRGHRGR